MMKSVCAVAVAGLVASASAQTTVQVDQSDANWLGFMNVFELPANGGGFVFGSGWGLADLVSEFDDGNNTLTLSPNTVGDTNEFWYQNTTGMAADPANPGGPGQLGNKFMEANIFQEVGGGGLSGQTVTFDFSILSNSTTQAHSVTAFIRDFAGDFGSFEETNMVITGPGDYSISLDTIDDASRVVQWGFRFEGENVWVTDVAPFGNVVIGTIPTPASAALLGLGGLVATRRRR